MESIDEEDNIGRIPTSSSSQKLLGTGNKEDQKSSFTNIMNSDKNYNPRVGVLNADTDDELLITGYAPVLLREIFACFLVLITGGFAYLIFYWRPDWKLKLTHIESDLAKAKSILVKEKYKDYIRYYVKEIHEEYRVEIDDDDKEKKKQKFLVPSPYGSEFKSSSVIRRFNVKKRSYLWDQDSQIFYRVDGLENEIPLSYFHEQDGLSEEERDRRAEIYGINDIVVPDHSIFYLLVKEVLNPFYVFQVASVTLWFSDEYYYYAAAIVVMSAGGILFSVIQTRKNQRNLKSTIQSTDMVTVLRPNDVTENVYSDVLVPGDVIVIPSHGCQLNCDAVLISGNAIVNEAMLTGEAVPVTKTTLPKNSDSYYKDQDHGRHTLYCGTRVIQTRYYGNHKVLAVVVRTGFMTAKGSLVRSIMYPPPVDFKFEQDSYKFVGFLSFVASFGFFYTCYRKLSNGDSMRDIALDAFDLITITVPPALPAAMTIGSIYAQKRLEKKDIFCISPRSINVSGSVDCICFDKTGTLTEDGLDLWGLVPTNSKEFKPPIQTSQLNKDDECFMECMASCHSLTIIDDKICGDPMDQIMFQHTGWVLEEPKDNYDTLAPTVVRPPNQSAKRNGGGGDVEVVMDGGSPVVQLEIPENNSELGIVRQFPFHSVLQRMSVITRKLGAKNFILHAKGSPEMILSLSKPETIPFDFHTVLERYAEKGYRVIGLARKELNRNYKYPKIQRLDRSEVEKDLHFLGFVVFENRLKPETKPVLHQLTKANIRSIMVTGDNLLTAISVARESELLPNNSNLIVISLAPNQELVFKKNDNRINYQVNGNNNREILIDVENKYHFALDGKTFDVIRDRYAQDILPKLVTRGAVFARMKPDQKQQLIEELKCLGYYVGMCGDGANDCGALKAAHAGISLSDAESSVASPFTSKEPNISCVPELIREGRCALVTSFGIFKYMAAYSLTQFTSVILLYEIESNLSDIQFLYIDLFLITVFAFFFGMTAAYPGELAKHPPMKSLISFTPISSLLLQMGPIIGFQLWALMDVQTQEWFVPFHGDNANYTNTSVEEYYANSTIDDSEVACWENYAVFTISSFQYIILAYVFSKAAPYRKTVISNYGLLFSIFSLTAFTIYVVLHPSKYLQNSFELLLPPQQNYIWKILGIALLNIIICILLEDFVVEFLIFKKLRHFFRRSDSKRKYINVNKELNRNLSWPCLTENGISPNDENRERRSTEENSPIQIDSQIIFDENEAFQKFSTDATHHIKASVLNKTAADHHFNKSEIFSTPLHSFVENNLIKNSQDESTDDKNNVFHSIESTPGSFISNREDDDDDDRFISCKSLNR